MNTKQKAEQFVEDNTDLIMEFGTHTYDDLVSKINHLLKEQDRDTRHACAEVVAGLPSEVANDGIRDVIGVGDAQMACMNCRGGLE